MPSNPVRDEIIANLVGERRKGLEIGPSHSPVFPKAAGHDVEILDYCSADELRARYGGKGLDVSSIEEVDYISDGGLPHDAIPHRARYDFVFASNVIEHTPNFIGFFQSCEMLLKPGGALVLAIPDKRWCFDAMQPVSTTGDILQAHQERRTRHNPGRAFDTIVNILTAAGSNVWMPHSSINQLELGSSIDKAKHIFDRLCDENSPYIDEHTWRFTPTSFRLIMQDLNYLGVTSLKHENLILYPGFEFFMSFSQNGQGFYEHRLDLLRKICQEQIEGLSIIVNAA